LIFSATFSGLPTKKAPLGPACASKRERVTGRKPRTFAAAFPICGGAHPATSKRIRKTSWWLFHGLKDNVVDPVHSQKMETALRKAKADIRATYYPLANHNSWDPAFAEPELLQWLFSKRKK
jgi:predicted peptidase